MRLRPCIDIHNGSVKQIVGGSLKDQDNFAKENFVSERDAGFYAQLYRDKDLYGGHIILLNPEGSEFYEADVVQARQALAKFPGGLQIGGGMNSENAKAFLDMGASHIIVTSYVFRNGQIHYDRLREMVKQIGKEHLVLDLSCRKRDGAYYVVTDRWQTFTEEVVNEELLNDLSGFCDEFLIHGVDAEGARQGMELPLVRMLGDFDGIPVTYAGGVSSFEDLELVRDLGKNRLDVTIGSALDLFGGTLRLDQVLEFMERSSGDV